MKRERKIRKRNDDKVEGKKNKEKIKFENEEGKARREECQKERERCIYTTFNSKARRTSEPYIKKLRNGIEKAPLQRTDAGSLLATAL